MTSNDQMWKNMGKYRKSCRPTRTRTPKSGYLKISVNSLLSHCGVESCVECHTARLQQKALEWLQYRCATVYVRKITKDHDISELQQISPSNKVSQPGG